LSTFVLDASGLLALLLDEEGAAEVEQMLANSGAISSGNLAEALSKVAERGADPGEVARDLELKGILGGLLEVEAVTAQDAITIAQMRPATKEHGLGLGDRICLALGRRLDLPVLTADRAWVELEEVLGVKVRALR
jgi:ribonuclease VapC